MKSLFSHFTYDLAESINKDSVDLFNGSNESFVAKFIKECDKNNFIDKVRVAVTQLEGGGDVSSELVRLYVDFVRLKVLPEMYTDKNFNLKGKFGTAFENYLKTYTYHEVLEDCKDLARLCGLRIGMLQVATMPNVEERKKLINDFFQKYPNSLLLITEQSELLGGVRLLIDNEVVDRSWKGQVNKIIDLMRGENR